MLADCTTNQNIINVKLDIWQMEIPIHSKGEHRGTELGGFLAQFEMIVANRQIKGCDVGLGSMNAQEKFSWEQCFPWEAVTGTIQSRGDCFWNNTVQGRLFQEQYSPQEVVLGTKQSWCGCSRNNGVLG
jgi:hypothetical protein